jgi:Fur family ferric uptake transcriptional regulator
MSGMPAFSGARDIYRALRGDGERIGLATVYRHLHVLAEQGDVDTIHTATGESRYRLRASSATYHLICRACGRIVEVDGSEIREWAERVAAEAGFTLTAHAIELSGLCPEHAGEARAHGRSSGEVSDDVGMIITSTSTEGFGKSASTPGSKR